MSQIANITPYERITYQCAPAKQLPLADDCASLITATQAAHWFNLPAFYQQVKKAAAPGCVMALSS
ncbi:methyltransferase domain-containing protein [Comamonas sp. PE63]|uniref:methyltransferase domain-containing protein n=1 Tax=Comamonas brasiliensis TaxID=1812482 RepID=UPI00201657D0|nr:methyltransferase domain-containing protein [Comamonas sp. PE63]